MLIKKSLHVIAILFIQLILLSYFHHAAYGIPVNENNLMVIKTLHFDIYYPDDMTDLAIYTAKIAEESYVYLANYLKHELNIHISLIIHPANTGYYEDLYCLNYNADRIELSFKESYSLYHEELTHMLTHSFQYDFLYNSTPGWEISYTALLSDYPEQIIEGAALYLSEGYDEYAEMIIRDIIYSSKADKYINIMNLNSFKNDKDLSAVLYKSFYYFLETEINQDIIADLLFNIKDSNSINKAIELTTGTAIKELSAKWAVFYQQRYSAALKGSSTGNNREIVLHDLNGSMPVIALNPALNEKDWLFLQNIDNRIKLSKIKISGREDTDILLYQCEFDPSNLQNYFSFSDYPSFSGDSRIAIFAKRIGERDIITLFDTSQRQKITEIKLPFKRIMDATISKDGKFIIFSGKSNSSTDLYIYTIENKAIRRLTNDLFFERYPQLSSDNSFAVFSSNENTGSDIESKKYKIIKLDLRTSVKSILIDNNASNMQPDISWDGKKIIYTSDRSGVFNIYCYNTDDGKTSRVTDNPAGVFFSRWLPDGKGIVAVSYQDFKYRIFIKYTEQADTIKDSAAARPAYKSIKYTDSYFAHEDLILCEYTNGSNLKTDFKLGAVIWDENFSGTANIKIYDYLNEHELEFSSDYLKYDNYNKSNYYLDYKYLKYRMDFGFGFFYRSNPLRAAYLDKLPLNLYADNTEAKNTGIYGLLSYPFLQGLSLLLRGSVSTFENINFRENINARANSSNNIYSNDLYLSFSYDTLILNKLWPVNGTKCEVAYSRNFSGRMGDLSFSTITFNFCKLFQFDKLFIFYFNGSAGRISGRDSYNFQYYLGGPGSIRGHDLFSYRGQNAVLCNMELRFTLFEILIFNWPALIKFNDIILAFFADFGSVWDKDFKFKNSNTGEFEDLKAGLGAGIRFFMLDHIVFKLDAAWPYYYKSFGECEIISGFEVRF